MIKETDITLPPEKAYNISEIKEYLEKQFSLTNKEYLQFKILKRSIDARSVNIKIHYKILVALNEQIPSENNIIKYKESSKGKKVLIIGAGPAGLFAALRLLEYGIKPIILERGKDVSSRKKDIAALNSSHILNTDSNYCFGEGGAGTFSDGKLYTRSNKRGDIQKILNVLVNHGANSEILFDSHPHIGTDKLPKIIAKIRETIINNGGEIHFNSKVTDFIINNKKIKGVISNISNEYLADSVILATGHSAKDIFELLNNKKIYSEPKPFALGVRVEHPQALIDKIQYKSLEKRKYLPAATYSLVEQIDGRGVFSFCMCPGGIIVPASTSENQLVVNGMSNSQRNSPYANSGIVVQINLEDLKDFEKHGNFSALKYQENIEKKACINKNNPQTAPAQRLVDFFENRISGNLPKTTYNPGIESVSLKEILPENVSLRLQKALKLFDKKMKGFFTNEALLIGVESRTSSPIKINRNSETYEHIEIERFYPCGEGSGYAGGIVSSAIDGENVANAIIKKLL